MKGKHYKAALDIELLALELIEFNNLLFFGLICPFLLFSNLAIGSGNSLNQLGGDPGLAPFSSSLESRSVGVLLYRPTI